MRVLVAGATSVPGIPLLRELNARGHDVVGLTSQPTKTPQIEQEGAKPVVANVFDAAQINAVVADIEPEAVISLLTTLPKWGPKGPRTLSPRRSCGAPAHRTSCAPLSAQAYDGWWRSRWSSPTAIRRPARY